MGIHLYAKKKKKKYPDLYGYSINTNNDGSKTLIASRNGGFKEQSIVDYYYSTSPDLCDNYQKQRSVVPR